MVFSKSGHCRRLKAERLEQRVVLAGNVDVALSFTELSLVGDADNNAIEVEEISPNQIKVTGLAGTTINSGVVPVVISAPLIDAVRVPPSAWMTSQSTVIVFSPNRRKSTAARNARPIKRCIS